MNKVLETHREIMAYEAIKNNEILDLMKGQGKYFYAEKNEPGPFNAYEVLSLLYTINVFDKELNVCHIFIDTLQKLLFGDTNDLYLAILYFVSHIDKSKRTIYAFKFDDCFEKDYLKQLKEKINLHKEVLKQEKSIYGVNKWWSIERNNEFLLKITDYKLSLL